MSRHQNPPILSVMSGKEECIVKLDVDPRTVLTTRQQEVLVLIAQGLTNPQIAERLFISPATVENHITEILGRLGVKNRTEAAVLAVISGLLGDVLQNGRTPS